MGCQRIRNPRRRTNQPNPGSFTCSLDEGVNSFEQQRLLRGVQFLNLLYPSQNLLQMVDLRLGSSSSDEWDWNRGALIFYYGTQSVQQWNPFANDTDNNGNVRRALHYVPKDDAISAYAVTMLEDYSYDSLNRIANVSESYQNEGGTWTLNYLSQSFGYDRYGNRQITAATGGVNDYNPSYNQANNRIHGLTYDAVGNITSDPSTGGTMSYDAENRLLTATSGGGGSYTYDGEGRRVKRAMGGQEWWYVYGIDGELIAEYVASAPSVVKKEYGYRGGQLLVVWDGEEVGDKQLKWLVKDHLGSVRMEADKSGSLAGIRRHDYLPFGEELYAGLRRKGSGEGQYGYEPPQSNVRQRFGSKERDTETGLDYFGARYYGNIQGRFTSVDTGSLGKRHLINPQKWNRYSYTINNPLRYFDPDGMEEIEVILRTFIPAKTVRTPDGRTFEGDGRKLGEPGTFRTQQRITIETDPNKRGGRALVSSMANVGLTKEILPDGNVRQKRANGDTLKATADYQVDNMGEKSLVKVTLQGNESNPLVKGAPGITYDINIYVQSSGPEGAAIITVYGEHDGFPGYELFVVRPETGDSSAKFIVGYEPTDKETPMALFPPLDMVMQKTEILPAPERKKRDEDE